MLLLSHSANSSSAFAHSSLQRLYTISICLSGISGVSSMYLFRGLFRQHPTANVCAVAQYRKRVSQYQTEMQRDSRNACSGLCYMNSILDENDVPMEDGEVAWDSLTDNNTSSPVNIDNPHRWTSYPRNATTGARSGLPRIPRIPIYLWSPLFSYRLFSNRNSTEMNEIQYKMAGTFRSYMEMTRYDDSDSPYWEEPLQIVFLFI
jgi:hypothetical protein